MMRPLLWGGGWRWLARVLRFLTTRGREWLGNLRSLELICPERGRFGDRPNGIQEGGHVVGERGEGVGGWKEGRGLDEMLRVTSSGNGKRTADDRLRKRGGERVVSDRHGVSTLSLLTLYTPPPPPSVNAGSGLRRSCLFWRSMFAAEGITKVEISSSSNRGISHDIVSKGWSQQCWYYTLQPLNREGILPLLRFY